MLVTCNQCGVGFDHAIGRCVACGTAYAPSGTERLAILTRDTEGWLRNGAPTTAIVRRLIDDGGVSEVEAHQVLQRAKSTLRDESRRHGAHIGISGIILLMIAAAVHLLTAGWIIATGCLYVGGAMLAFGALKAFTGWNITGHDDE